MTTQPRRDITVRCAEDEEWVALTPRNVWNPAHWINMASQEFERVFNIRFIPFTTVSWISNPPTCWKSTNSDIVGSIQTTNKCCTTWIIKYCSSIY